MTKNSRKGQRAWLVTKHWLAKDPKWEVAAILSGRLGGPRVRELVELLYLGGGAFTLTEQLSMNWAHQGQIIYPAKFGQTSDGRPWECEIFCGVGNDLHFEARLVDDLIVKRDADGKETAIWKERPRP